MKPTPQDFYTIFCNCKFRKVVEMMQEGFSGMFFVLKILENAEEGLLAGDISAVFGVTTARTAVILATLERKGYIHKARGKDDARKTIVTITERGSRALAERKARIFGELDLILQRLGERDADEMYHILQKLMSN